MHGRTERAPGTQRLIRWLQAAGFFLLMAASALAQQPADDQREAAIWDAVAARIEAQIDDPATSTAELEALRDQLSRQRESALAAEKSLAPPIEDLKNRLSALGPPPAQGVTEAPEIAERRTALNQMIVDAQAPLLEAQETYERSTTLIGEIDRIVRGRFTAELTARGPSPLLPGTWTAAGSEALAQIRKGGEDLASRFREPVNRRLATERLPFNLLLLAAGVIAAFALRRVLIRWVERRLATTSNRRAAAWIVALRNLTRLVVPAVGAGLLFAAFDPNGLLAHTGEGRLFELPGFVMTMIGAGWLGGSLFAPRLEAHRLVPLDNAEALAASRLVLALGGVIALLSLAYAVIGYSDLSQAGQTALYYPLTVLGAVGLWQAANVIGEMHARMSGRPATESPTAQIGLRFLAILVRVLRAIAVTAPLIGLFGYIAAAAYLVFPTILTLGLMGGMIVIYDLLNKTALTFLAAPVSPSEDGGLIPVIVGALVGIASLPVLALIWGARPSDLAEVWAALANGVTLGGMRVSVTVVLTLIVVFGIVSAFTRLLQTILRGTVLPRTRLDAGGRNAILAGVGYLGFGLAVLAAVSAAGLDLSNVALVAGALSVGIGFGLQNIVSNFVSGIILLVERPVKEGDWIEVGGFSGYVRGINVRSTEIETFDRASVILPNSDLVAGTVLNRTHAGRIGRVQVPVGVSYDSDPRQVEEILLAIAEANPLVLEDPAPVVLFLGFGSDALSFEIRCWLRDVNFSLSARSDMNFEIHARFKAAGISIPFPQRDLHVTGLDDLTKALARPAPDSETNGQDTAVPLQRGLTKET